MANVLGSLVVKLGLDAAEFTGGLTKSEYEAQKFAKNMEKVGRDAGRLLGIGISAGATALFFMTKSAIDAADKLNDLSKSTGVSVETLGGLAFAAKQSGTDLDGVGHAFGKLNLQIAQAVSGDEKAQDAFKKLGISLQDLRDSSPDQILGKIADKFATYEDGPNKAAIANAYFGKSYQSIIPLLDEGGAKLQQSIEYFRKYGGVSKQVAEQADEFNDTLTKLGLLSGAFSRSIASQLLPSLQAVANEFVAAKEGADDFNTAAGDIVSVIKAVGTVAIAVSTEISGLGHAIGAIAAEAVALAKFDFGLVGRIESEAKADQDARYARAKKLIDAINNPPPPTVRAGGAAKGKAPSLTSSDTTDAAKAFLDAQLKSLDRAIREEQELLRDREHFLQQYYQDSYISIEEYYNRRQEVQDEALAKQRSAFAAEEAALRAFKPASQKERIANEERIAEVSAKAAKAEQDAAVKTADSFFERERAVKAFSQAVDQVAISLAAIRGDTVQAAALGFDAQYSDLRRRMQIEGQSTTAVDELRQRALDQARLNKATQEYSLTLDELGVATQHIANLQESGAVTELDALRLRSEETAKYVQALKAELAAVEAVAAASGKREDLVRVAQLKVQLEGLEMQGDLVAKKFQDIFTTSFTDALTDAIDGTKSLSDAFKSMERSIIQSISRIAAQNIAETIFGKNGPGGGIGGFFSWLFSGANPFSSSGASLPSQFGTAILGAASGTDFAPGGLTLVGERGPELVNLPRGAQVIPHSQFASRRGRSVSVTNNFVLSGAGVDRRTQSQIAVNTERAVRRAVFRDG